VTSISNFTNWQYGSNFQLKIIDSIDEMFAVEELQLIVWPGSETEVVPAHLLITAIHNGGLIIGAYYVGKNKDEYPEKLGNPPQIGFIFGFLGSQKKDDKVIIKHLSHQMGIHPDFRNKGIGFALKRAQWQKVRKQDIELITWTYDPLLSLNAYLNIYRLGTICQTYLQNVYGSLRDSLNKGLPTDRFQVELWVNSHRVIKRLSSQPRQKLDLAHFIAAEAKIINPTYLDGSSLPRIKQTILENQLKNVLDNPSANHLLLVEIPSDFYTLKSQSTEAAIEWKMLTRRIFESLFSRDYFVTDFIYLPGQFPRSYYVLSYGESTL